MKQKFYLVVLCLIVALQVQAQSTAKLSNIKWEGLVEFNSSKLGSMGSRFGFGVGVKGILEMPTISDGIYLSSGAFLERKGTDLDLGDLGRWTVSSYYLDIPIHIGYHYSEIQNLLSLERQDHISELVCLVILRVKNLMKNSITREKSSITKEL